MLSAGFGGICYIFYGKKDGTFSEVQVLKDKTGTDIHSGMYYDFNLNRYVTIKEIENGNKLDFVKAVDWDNDGDLDLLLCGSTMKLRVNEGSRINPVFAEKNIDVLNRHYADAIVDWDGDGLWDIVCGSKTGGVFYYKNIGKLGKPEFGEARCIFEKSIIEDKNRGVSCGLSQVAVADYNNDGKLDLIIGYNYRVTGEKPQLTVEQAAERDKLKKMHRKVELDAKRYSMDFKSRFKGKDIKKDKKYNILRKRSVDIYQRLKKFIPQTEAYGYVFVSLRK